jgi:hypothetical protein
MQALLLPQSRSCARASPYAGIVLAALYSLE